MPYSNETVWTDQNLARRLNALERRAEDQAECNPEWAKGLLHHATDIRAEIARRAAGVPVPPEHDDGK